MPVGQLQAWRNKAESHVITNLLTSNVQSLWENFTPWPCLVDLAITWSILQGLGLRFSRKDLTLS